MLSNIQDSDGSGDFSLDEFLGRSDEEGDGPRLHPGVTNHVRKFFEKLDRNDDDVVSADEIDRKLAKIEDRFGDWLDNDPKGHFLKSISNMQEALIRMQEILAEAEADEEQEEIAAEHDDDIRTPVPSTTTVTTVTQISFVSIQQVTTSTQVTA